MSERDAAIRELGLRALFKPSNLLPPAAVLAVGLIVGLWPLYIAAAVLYGVLAATTFFSADEAKKVLQARRGTVPTREVTPRVEPSLVDPLIRARYAEARDEEARIRAALQESPLPLPEVEIEIAGLMDDVRSLCQRAEAVSAYLRSVDERRLEARLEAVRLERDRAPADLRPTLDETEAALNQQLSTIGAMSAHMRRFHAQMTQLVSSMGAIRSQVVRLAVEAQSDAGDRVREQLASARALVGGITEGIDEAAGKAGGAAAAG